MKVLVLGGGGREHALVWALRKSARVTEVVCAPGNAGIAGPARCEPVDVSDVNAVSALVTRERPELVVVGPEVPLAAGVVDALAALEADGVRVFGPTQQAARLETSKGFAKQFMGRWGIATAAYRVCQTMRELDEALPQFGQQIVVKADGLAAGKGVVLCGSQAEARTAATDLLSTGPVVLEEMLEGPEVSFFAVCDGQHAVALAAAQDHKRVGEGDTGPNTGGMGAYSADGLVAPELAEQMLSVAQRVVDGMRAEGAPFQGVLFTGFMLTADGPKVLEFNTRFGDPETEAIVLRLETELLDLLEAAVDGRVDACAVRLKPGASACVVAASEGYPGKYAVGREIRGLAGPFAQGVEVFHAGTSLRDGEVVTAGGRVLVVAAAGSDLREALDTVYAALARISFNGMQYRRDIGWRALSPAAET